MKNNISNQNHGSRGFRNASITIYHGLPEFDTSSSQQFVQLDAIGPRFSGVTCILLGRMERGKAGLKTRLYDDGKWTP
jgi:hypothetical protein